MTKIRKYNGVYKLPIHKHTKIRLPQSDWLIYLNIPASFGNKYPYNPMFVQDITTGLENPLGTGTKYPYRRLDKFVELTDQAEQAIKDLLLSKLPEKKYVSEDEDPAKAYDDLVHQGYNQAIDEVEKVIEEL